MKFVITGSLGNISKPLVGQLVARNHEVVVISRNAEKQKSIELLGARAAIGSVNDPEFVTAAFSGADAVYCMIPPFDYFDPKLDIMASTREVFENYAQAIRRSQVKRVVHLSSVGAHREDGVGLLAFHYLAECILRQLPADVSITHMRPVGFYYNLYDFATAIEGKGMLGLFLTFRFSGLSAVLKGRRGIIAANYGDNDKIAWVSPLDIADAVAEELITPFQGRKVRYVASEELTCSEVARILGKAIGKPYLKWARMSDKQMLSGLKMFGIPQSRAEGIVKMNAGLHNGTVEEDYYRNRPKTMGRVKMADFAKEFAANKLRKP